MNKPAISIRNVSKAYRLYDSPGDRMKEALNPFRKSYHKDFFALKDVSLDIPRGGTYGIIGLNGSGKSTLLKLVCGVARPTSGEIEVNGRIAALLELGVGFNPEFTGRQNVFVSGALAGFSRAQMEERFDSIEEFADIGRFIDQPVKNYSSGMLVRLAFSVAIHQEPEILVIDEALSVGDARFQHKCMARMQEFKARSTILFVTHDMNAVVAFCDKAIWLDKGEMVRVGDPVPVADAYMEATYEGVKEEHKEKAGERPDALESFGRGNGRVASVRLFVDDERDAPSIRTGQELGITLEIEAMGRIEKPLAGFIVRNLHGVHVLQANTEFLDFEVPPMDAGQTRAVTFRLPWPNLAGGSYSLAVALADGTQHDHVQEHWIHNAGVVECIQDKRFNSILGPVDATVNLGPIKE